MASKRSFSEVDGGFGCGGFSGMDGFGAGLGGCGDFGGGCMGGVGGGMFGAAGMSGGMMGGSGMDPAQKRPRFATIEEFLAHVQLDEAAASAVRQSSPECQEFVLARGTLYDTRNPSAALLGRLRDYEAAASQTGQMNEFTQQALRMEVETFIAEGNVDERAADALRTSPPAAQRLVLDRGSLRDARNPSAALLGRLRDAQHSGANGPSAVSSLSCGGCGCGGSFSFGGVNAPMPEEVQGFIQENNLDERAGAALRDTPPEVQRNVIDRGSLSETTNPSAAVLGRIKNAMQVLGPGVSMPRFLPGAAANLQGAELAAAVEKLISEGNVDDRAAGALREASEAHQRFVVDRGDLRDARNPSASLLGRLRDAQRMGSGGMAMMGGGSAMSGMGMGARQSPGMSMGGHMGMMGMMGMMGGNSSSFGGCGGGGFGGGGCGFGNNKGMGMAKTSSMGQFGGMMPGMAQYGQFNMMGDNIQSQVQDFISHSNLDDAARAAFLGASPEVQQAVMDRGSLRDTRNPSAALLGRLRSASGVGFIR